MTASRQQSFRLPTGELVFVGASGDPQADSWSGLVKAFFKEEIVGFAFSLMSAFTALWFLAG